jgi:hypothetical protein
MISCHFVLNSGQQMLQIFRTVLQTGSDMGKEMTKPVGQQCPKDGNLRTETSARLTGSDKSARVLSRSTTVAVTVTITVTVTFTVAVTVMSGIIGNPRNMSAAHNGRHISSRSC